MTEEFPVIIVNCPYHPHWVRIGFLSAVYRSCPVCKYCIRCKANKRPIFSKHTHGKYQFSEAELARVTA